MYFSKRTKGPVKPRILSRIIIQRKGLNLATEGKDTPSNKNEGQNLATEGRWSLQHKQLFFLFNKNYVFIKEDQGPVKPGIVSHIIIQKKKGA